MPFQSVALMPGINVEFSPTLNRAGWSASNLMRFRMGLPEKIGGWLPISQTPVIGTGTGMKSWASLDGTAYVMVGTDQRLEIITGGVVYDITPLRATHNNAVSFSTIINTPTVKIIDAASNAAVGSWVYLSTPVSVGGLVLQGFYIVTGLIDANTYQITSPTNATATVVNGGAVPVFDTTNTSATVKVTLANHGLVTGSMFFIEVSTTVGGLTLSGSYVVTLIDADHFNITASIVATSTATASENGGNARINYLINSGSATNILLSGWGVGVYGSGLYGLASGSTLKQFMRQWTGDAWGGTLVACYTGGPIYQWIPPPLDVLPGNQADPAVILTNAPQQNTTIFVHMSAEILVAAGCEVGSVFDPLLVRWSDQDDLTVWTAASGNQAGSYRLKSGSRIVGAMMVPQGGLIWTDTGLWAMQYIGYPEIFGFTVLGRNCGLFAMRAAGYLNSTVYWMAHGNFYSASPGGAPSPLQCTVRDLVFENINHNQEEECFCGIDSLFNEIFWFYPSTDSDIADSYVKLNTLENTWDYGSLIRSCWDDGLVIGAPIGCDSMGLVQQHEVSPDGNGVAIPYSFTTGYFDIAEGEDFVTVAQIWPDFKETSGAAVQITVNMVDYPDQAPRVYGPYTVVQGTKQFISLNARGRQMQLTFAGNDIGSSVRLGRVRYSFAASGRRGVG